MELRTGLFILLVRFVVNFEEELFYPVGSKTEAVDVYA